MEPHNMTTDPSAPKPTIETTPSQESDEHREPGPPIKQGMSGCTIALLVLGALAVLALGTCGVGFYMVSQNETIQNAYKATVGMFNVAGREEMAAAGCQMAILVDFETLAKLNPDKDTDHTDMPKDKRLVVCNVARNTDAPTCDAIAKIYRAALSEPPEHFAVVVNITDVDDPQCATRYDAEANPIGPAELDDVKIPAQFGQDDAQDHDDDDTQP